MYRLWQSIATYLQGQDTFLNGIFDYEAHYCDRSQLPYAMSSVDGLLLCRGVPCARSSVIRWI